MREETLPDFDADEEGGPAVRSGSGEGSETVASWPFFPLPGGPGGDTKSVTTQLNVVNVGNAQILTIPGEALPNIGYYLKRKMRGQNNLLFGLTNDAFGYILTKEDYNSFERYDYVSRTSMGERTGTVLVDEALKFVNECPKPEEVNKVD